jgi:hypothetical protein
MLGEMEEWRMCEDATGSLVVCFVGMLEGVRDPGCFDQYVIDLKAWRPGDHPERAHDEIKRRAGAKRPRLGAAIECSLEARYQAFLSQLNTTSRVLLERFVRRMQQECREASRDRDTMLAWVRENGAPNEPETMLFIRMIDQPEPDELALARIELAQLTLCEQSPSLRALFDWHCAK